MYEPKSIDSGYLGDLHRPVEYKEGNSNDLHSLNTDLVVGDFVLVPLVTYHSDGSPSQIWIRKINLITGDEFERFSNEFEFDETQTSEEGPNNRHTYHLILTPPDFINPGYILKEVIHGEDYPVSGEEIYAMSNNSTLQINGRAIYIGVKGKDPSEVRTGLLTMPSELEDALASTQDTWKVAALYPEGHIPDVLCFNPGVVELYLGDDLFLKIIPNLIDDVWDLSPNLRGRIGKNRYETIDRLPIGKPLRLHNNELTKSDGTRVKLDNDILIQRLEGGLLKISSRRMPLTITART